MEVGTAGRPDAVLARAAALRARGYSFALATVIRRRPPVSSRAGDKALITADGRIEGWIGGSCSESIVRRQALAALADGQPRLIQIRVDVPADAATAEESDEGQEPGAAGGEGDARVVTVAMTCPSGGEVDVYIEPFVRPPQLIACGDTPLAYALVQMAAMVGFEPVLVYGREAPPEAAVPGGRAISVDALEDFEPVPEAYAVVATMGHFDEECLQRWLAAGVPYVALVASRKRAAAVKEVLAGAGVPAADLERVRNPAGLDLGAVTQEEIAVSILADIIRQRRARLRAHAGMVVGDEVAARLGAEGAGTAAGAAERAAEQPAASTTHTASRPVSTGAATQVAAAASGSRAASDGAAKEAELPAVARDPVCGMEVVPGETRHVAEYEGRQYYFCCPHCKATFLKDPERYVESA
ncbi:XdhC family protein [Thermaerobacter composti]|uniref:XdhC family protein n=1 Tax=Thermaerobacter composti TaxID=554949 RepID=A0ABZ0QPB2_9FIRM|nr:XdhC family protein [Thermaerobacter composti]WPD18243.1 XdhC family protein [Thermaerobacter composti]